MNEEASDISSFLDMKSIFIIEKSLPIFTLYY